MPYLVMCVCSPCVQAAHDFDSSSLSRQPSRSVLQSETSEGGLSSSAPVNINSRQHKTVSGLLASLQHTAGRGTERLQRLERVLNTIAADASEPDKVCCCRRAPGHLSTQKAEVCHVAKEAMAAMADCFCWQCEQPGVHA